MLTQEELSGVVRMIFETREKEIGCDECLLDVASYAEARLLGATIPEALQRVEEHLGGCPNCTEEYEALREALRAIEDEPSPREAQRKS